MSFYSPQQLSGLLHVQFANAFPPQSVKFLAPSAGKMLILVQSSWPYKYGIEQSIFGRSIRLLWELERTKNLIQRLDLYGIQNVILTEASEPDQSNNQNTIILKIDFIRSAFKDLTMLTKSGNAVVEIGIKALIAENSNR